MSYLPRNANGQAVMASSAPIVLASDQSNVPVAQPDATAAISIAANATTSGQCASNGGAGTFIFQLSGTWTATVVVQITRDGTNWVNINGSGAVVSLTSQAVFTNGQIIANGIYAVSVAGVVGARLITTAYTSGTVVGTAALTLGTGLVALPGLSQTTLTSQLSPRTTGGNLIHTSSITNTVTQVKSVGGQVYGWSIYNANASAVYVQFFALATGSVTLGTTAPVLSIGIPATSRAEMEWPLGLAFANAINVAVTTTRAGSTAPSISVDLNIFYI